MNLQLQQLPSEENRKLSIDFWFILIRILVDFLFPVLLKGESGLGKSTLINSLFLTDLYPERIIPGAAGETSAAFS